MRWQIDTIPSLLLHLPHALHDLLAQENQALVETGITGLTLHAHPATPSPSASEKNAPPTISLEKSLDPFVERSVANLGLLLHDYLSQLPAVSVDHHAGEALMEHWRQILLEQPQRLAVVKQAHWHDEKTRAFWQARLAKDPHLLAADPASNLWDDWQRASGIPNLILHPLHKTGIQQRQWQDLVIRTRLHQESLNQGRMR